jgi:hypothetical protein
MLGGHNEVGSNFAAPVVIFFAYYSMHTFEQERLLFSPSTIGDFEASLK